MRTIWEAAKAVREMEDIILGLRELGIKMPIVRARFTESHYISFSLPSKKSFHVRISAHAPYPPTHATKRLVWGDRYFNVMSLQKARAMARAIREEEETWRGKAGKG